jgi:hypothetical protein
MNASLAGAMTETRLPKKTPVAIPRMNPTSIQDVRFRRGSLMVVFLSLITDARTKGSLLYRNDNGRRQERVRYRALD